MKAGSEQAVTKDAPKAAPSNKKLFIIILIIELRGKPRHSCRGGIARRINLSLSLSLPVFMLPLSIRIFLAISALNGCVVDGVSLCKLLVACFSYKFFEFILALNSIHHSRRWRGKSRRSNDADLYG